MQPLETTFSDYCDSRCKRWTSTILSPGLGQCIPRSWGSCGYIHISQAYDDLFPVDANVLATTTNIMKINGQINLGIMYPVTIIMWQVSCDSMTGALWQVQLYLYFLCLHCSFSISNSTQLHHQWPPVSLSVLIAGRQEYRTGWKGWAQKVELAHSCGYQLKKTTVKYYKQGACMCFLVCETKQSVYVNSPEQL